MKNTKFSIKVSGIAKRLLCAALIIMMTLGALGCKQEEAPLYTPTPIALAAVTPEPLPAQGGTLILPMPLNPFVTDDSGTTGMGLTPLVVNTEEMRNLCSLIYEPFVRTDSENRIVPSLAEKWSCDETGLTWNIQLRHGVRWHDGDILSARDVVYTMDQIRSAGEESYYFSTIDQYVASYEQTDELTVRVTMKEKGIMSLYSLLFPVVKAEAATGAETLMGTGPYRMERYYAGTSAQTLELVANDKWWKQRPYIDMVLCLARENNAVALDSFEAGLMNMVPTETVSAGKYRSEGVSNVKDVHTQDAEILVINHTSAALGDVNVRKAIAMALDRSTIVSNVYMNRATLSDVPVPTDSFLYSAASKIYDYTPSTAKTLFAEAGYEDRNDDGILEKGGRDFRITLLVNESTESTYRKSAAALVEAQLEAVGVDVEVISAKYKLGETDSDFEGKLRNKEFDIALIGLNLPRNGDLSACLTSEGSRNYGGYYSADMESLIAKARTAPDETALREAHSAIQQKFVEELPFIMLYFRLNSVIYSADIKNVTEIRETDVLRTVEKWYIQSNG